MEAGSRYFETRFEEMQSKCGIKKGYRRLPENSRYKKLNTDSIMYTYACAVTSRMVSALKS